MPYTCIQSGGKWKCINEDTRKVHGTHDTKGSCMAQVRALYANVKEGK